MDEPRFNGSLSGIQEDVDFLREMFPDWYFSSCGVDGIGEVMATLAANNTWQADMGLELVRWIINRFRDAAKKPEAVNGVTRKGTP